MLHQKNWETCMMSQLGVFCGTIMTLHQIKNSCICSNFCRHAKPCAKKYNAVGGSKIKFIQSFLNLSMSSASQGNSVSTVSNFSQRNNVLPVSNVSQENSISTVAPNDPTYHDLYSNSDRYLNDVSSIPTCTETSCHDPSNKQVF